METKACSKETEAQRWKANYDNMHSLFVKTMRRMDGFISEVKKGALIWEMFG
ncbi:hypothetical protein DPMN_080677 [Dreissena polymorpha]|uniref:Uncharacterized protein n=1 Tax=Dreissena polymorpha TaxID=45954 RepID=A0A9D4BJG4_DREPO|nr:hypothetical protein DPMN_080677 [Dreissena polymorpha]